MRAAYESVVTSLAGLYPLPLIFRVMLFVFAQAPAILLGIYVWVMVVGTHRTLAALGLLSEVLRTGGMSPEIQHFGLAVLKPSPSDSIMIGFLGLNFALGLVFQWVLFAAGRQARALKANAAAA